MMTDPSNSAASIKDSILAVISRIRETARSREGTKLPTASFSNAINAIGEEFVDALLHTERKGRWWLADDGQWQECTVKRLGERTPRNFVKGNSAEWSWFPLAASRLADPMTGPDHVVSVVVPSLNLSANLALEQKLRFGTRQDAFADSSTYVKHLLAGLTYPQPSKRDFHTETYCNGLLEATKAVLCKTKDDGSLTYSGSVPHVCYVSLRTPPNKIIVCSKETSTTVECDFVGFLPPAVNEAAFVDDSSARRVVHHAGVRLWVGLDSLLRQCGVEEVEAAWSGAIEGLSQTIREPQWRA